VWQNDDLGVAVESGTSPSAYLGAGGTEFVYYVGSDGVLRVDHWTGSVWQNDDLGVAVESGTGLAPTWVRAVPNSCTTWAAMESCALITGRARCGGTTTSASPWNRHKSSAYLGAGGTEFVYYVGSDGVLRVDHWTGSVWQNDDLGVAVESGTSPSAYLGAGGTEFVYYVGSDGVLRVDHWTGSVWQNDDLGVAVESGTSPSAYLGAGGTEFVHYVGSDGVLRVDHWTCSVWQNDDLGVAVESGTSPSAYLA